MKIKNITSNNIPFTVRLVEKGENYGLNNCLTHDQDEAMVEFYDARYPHTEYGQFVSRYFFNTLLERKSNIGLCLDGGVKDWSIDAQVMNDVTDWLKSPKTKNKM